MLYGVLIVRLWSGPFNKQNTTIDCQNNTAEMTPPALSMVSGSTLIARLTPMKRILCLCPVQGKTETDFTVGLAVSDPYLARASPLRELDGKWKVRAIPSNITDSLPPNLSSWRKDLENYPDIGAIALATPMLDESHSKWKSDHVVVDDVKDFILNELLPKRYLSEDANFAGAGLVCDIEDRLLWREAQQLAEDDLEMWEDLQGDEVILQKQASTHAYVALNYFLWLHTGGWQNTFG